MNGNIDYQPTGNQINLPVDKLISFVHEKISEYERLFKAIGTQPGLNPFKDPIIFTTEEGKTVQVPDYVQKEAIKSWNQNKKNTKLKGNKITPTRQNIKGWQNDDFSSSSWQSADWSDDDLKNDGLQNDNLQENNCKSGMCNMRSELRSYRDNSIRRKQKRNYEEQEIVEMPLESEYNNYDYGVNLPPRNIYNPPNEVKKIYIVKDNNTKYILTIIVVLLLGYLAYKYKNKIQL